MRYFRFADSTCGASRLSVCWSTRWGKRTLSLQPQKNQSWANWWKSGQPNPMLTFKLSSLIKQRAFSIVQRATQKKSLMSFGLVKRLDATAWRSTMPLRIQKKKVIQWETVTQTGNHKASMVTFTEKTYDASRSTAADTAADHSSIFPTKILLCRP